MDCEAASERLPWLLNGSLEEREAQEIRDHLSGCPRCRGGMEETRRAAAVFGAHLPTGILLNLAWEMPVEGLDPALVRRHLDGCADCQQELALARESRRLELGAVDPPGRPRQAAWTLFALPATLAAGLVIGLWWSGRQPGGLPADERARVSVLEAEINRLRGVVASLEGAARKAEPRFDLPVFEILPGRVLRGEADADDNPVAVPAAATEIVLLLAGEAAPGTPATLDIHDGQGREVWRGGGLVYRPPSGYVVTVPVRILPAGSYVLTVRPRDGSPIVYRVRVHRTPE